jgi:hypothetical protein
VNAGKVTLAELYSLCGLEGVHSLIAAIPVGAENYRRARVVAQRA